MTECLFCAPRIAELEAEVQRLRDQLADEATGNRLGGFSRDSETSRQAALDNYPRSGSQRARVLGALIASQGYGRTRAELAEQLGLPDSSADGRVWELLHGGFIRELERTRATPTGSQAKVLVPTAKGYDAVGVTPDA